MKTTPLVSILVISYNSSKTILETLESAKEQTYPNIELIISDDCSKDDTVELCKKWLLTNSKRFVNTSLVISNVNKGVSANCNQAITHATGVWGKIIAGDDILLPNCISSNLCFTDNNPEACFIFSKMRTFVEKNGKKDLQNVYPIVKWEEYFDYNAEEQHGLLCHFSFLPTPTFFFKIDEIRKNMYNESYRFCEDYPQWFNLTGRGYKLYLNPSELVLYRIEESLFQSSNRFVNPNFMLTYKLFFYNEVAPELYKKDMLTFIKQEKKIFLYDFSIIILKNKKNLFTKVLYRLFSKILFVI